MKRFRYSLLLSWCILISLSCEQKKTTEKKDELSQPPIILNCSEPHSAFIVHTENITDSGQKTHSFKESDELILMQVDSKNLKGQKLSEKMQEFIQQELSQRPFLNFIAQGKKE